MTILSAVSVERLTKFNQTIAQWTRLSGTPDERAAAEYAVSELRAIGFDARLILHDAYISLPGSATLRLTAPEARSLPCITHSMGRSTEPGGQTAELLDAGAGSVDELTRAGAAGKFALVEGRATPQLAVNASRAGVAGLVCISGRIPHEMCCSPIWGNPAESTRAELPDVVLLSVSRADGERLRDACRRGRVDIHATAEVTTAWTTTPIVVADLKPGHADAEPTFVLFSGHLDSWYAGAMDNGSANATMLEVARLMAEQRAALRRGLRVAMWSGHSHGRYSSSAWYVDNHWTDLDERCVVHVNIDSVGAVDADDYETNSMPETIGLASDTVKRVTGGVLHGKRTGRNSDQSFMGVGLPSILGSVSRQKDGTLGWWWHTPEDTLDKIDPPRLLRDAKIFAVFLHRWLTDAVLPLDYAASAADIRENLTAVASHAGRRFDLAEPLAEALRLQQLCRRLKTLSRGATGELARAINDCLRHLGRTLIPVTYTSAGRHAHDPALDVPFLPKLQAARRLASLPAGSDAEKFLLVDLTRARNEVVAALRKANAAVQWCLATAPVKQRRKQARRPAAPSRARSRRKARS